MSEGSAVRNHEIMATAVKRQHEPQRIVGDLLNAEINERQVRSIKGGELRPKHKDLQSPERGQYAFQTDILIEAIPPAIPLVVIISPQFVCEDGCWQLEAS
jgi:hypothetical protein